MSTPARKKNKPNDKKWLWNHIHLSIFLLLVSFLLSAFIGLAFYGLAALEIPDITSVASYDPPAVTVFLDNQGEVVGEFYRERRYLVSLDKMPDLMPLAFVAAEDGRFFEHGGVDGWSVLRALVNNLRSGRRSQGGSTITQQIARSLLLSREKTYTRKLKEAILAYRIDRLLGKDEILYMYLNQIYLGEGAYGVEAAARVYFDKHVDELGLPEISLLAGLPQAPSRYSPLKNLKLAKGRQRYVLNRMAADGYITPEEARAAYLRGLQLKVSPRQDNNGSEKYFVEHVRRYVESKYGAGGLLTEGLVVHTTMNSAIQEKAVASVRNGIRLWRSRNSGAEDVPQTALVAIEVGSSRVVAMVGGNGYGDSQYNRAVQAKRQPGSAFKPIIYGTALQRAVTPADLLLDEPLKLPGNVSGRYWQPKNFDGEYHGLTTVWTGLVKSRNIISIKLLQRVGIESVRSLAGRMGITAELDNNLSLALGASGISLLEMTGAYNVFAGLGMYRSPFFVKKIVDRYGNVLETGETRQKVRRALAPKDAYLVTSLLKGAIEHGTGRLAKGLGLEAAGKTGTSDGNMDAWFVGYTPEIVAGVWLGFDQNISLGESETGGKAAAPVWRDFMKGVYLVRPMLKKKFPVPEGVLFLSMAPETGVISKEKDGDAVVVAFKENLMPAK